MPSAACRTRSLHAVGPAITALASPNSVSIRYVRDTTTATQPDEPAMKVMVLKQAMLFERD
jgi:hypothetical protein